MGRCVSVIVLAALALGGRGLTEIEWAEMQATLPKHLLLLLNLELSAEQLLEELGPTLTWQFAYQPAESLHEALSVIYVASWPEIAGADNLGDKQLILDLVDDVGSALEADERFNGESVRKIMRRQLLRLSLSHSSLQPEDEAAAYVRRLATACRVYLLSLPAGSLTQAQQSEWADDTRFARFSRDVLGVLAEAHEDFRAAEDLRDSGYADLLTTLRLLAETFWSRARLSRAMVREGVARFEVVARTMADLVRQQGIDSSKDRYRLLLELKHCYNKFTTMNNDPENSLYGNFNIIAQRLVIAVGIDGFGLD